MPERVTFSASKDGNDYDVFDVRQRHHRHPGQGGSGGAISHGSTDCDKVPRGEGRGAWAHPEWHLGRGNDRWMFLDEIHVELKP